MRGEPPQDSYTPFNRFPGQTISHVQLVLTLHNSSVWKEKEKGKDYTGGELWYDGLIEKWRVQGKVVETNGWMHKWATGQNKDSYSKAGIQKRYIQYIQFWMSQATKC